MARGKAIRRASPSRELKAARANARGYRSTRNLKAIIYLIAGKFELALPTRFSEQPVFVR
jgi:hypothetical protein